MSMTDALTHKPMARPAVKTSGPYVHPQHKAGSAAKTAGPNSSRLGVDRTGK